jgi:hypothetical protein
MAEDSDVDLRDPARRRERALDPAVPGWTLGPAAT